MALMLQLTFGERLKVQLYHLGMHLRKGEIYGTKSSLL